MSTTFTWTPASTPGSEFGSFQPSSSIPATRRGRSSWEAISITNNFLWLRRVIPIPFVGRQVKRVTRYMAKHDFTSPFESFERGTHELFNLKLDWIFARGAEFLDAEIEIVGFSDHHLIWAKIGEGSPDS